ncbi:MAG: hypothetical protein JRH16_13290 [Deltaproteobacteria bacterium]|nr:hypothetical protein [Deltaproteobacteria bacterium]MBW2361293.1 hypothetical protein [Deltaproteobacteria bacterium]
MRTPHRTTLLRLGVAACVFAGLCSAFPEQAWHWDEFQLAYAVRDFDLARHQPHPPGYYLFVVAGRALDALLGDPFLALRCVSGLAIAAFASMAIGAPAAGTTPIARGLWVAAAAGFGLASPLTQRFGVAALTYAAEGAIWMGWLLALGQRPRARGRLVLAATAGLAGGVRPTLALWAGAMLLFDVARRRDWRSLAGLGLAGAAGGALWVIPLLWESGGIAAYRADAGPLAVGNIWNGSVFVAGFDGWRTRLADMGLDLLTALGGLVAVVVAALALRVRKRAAEPVAYDVLLQGAALAFGFYALVIYDTAGYLMAVVLPLAAWALRSAAASAANWPARNQAAAAGAALVLAVVGTLAPDDRIDPHYAEHARLLDARFAPVRAGFDPRSTLLITSREYWDYALRHVAHALPEFTTLQLAKDPYFTISNAAQPYLSARQRRIAAVGPDPLDLATLTPSGRLAQVVYMVPFDAQEFIARACGELAEALQTSSDETLPVLRLRPGWRIEARNQRLHCARSDAR